MRSRKPRSRPLRAVLKVAIFALVLLAVNQLAQEVRQALDFDIRPSNEATVHRMLMFVAVLYAVTLALPFVPGVEIGLGLIAVLGPGIALLVYVSTVAGLVLGFLLGRIVPERVLVGLARDLGLRRSAVLLSGFAALSPEERLERLFSVAPNRFSTLLIRHRYIALAIVVNLPGNFLVGGGGGIAMLAGLSRLFSFPLFALTIAVAVSPVPVALHVWGPSILGP
ncbi:hypothetical protein DQW77_14890 [Roseovarius sp. TE539]|uniref:hypothetical protein n=1 Tax=Roseovarius sp. TE539 TaxID=2249812 RepID=UPI000DDDFA3A|nr:hypothetical protein [Roseovarius sp. TE539]RBI69957.1 hypothetical protein DQW77_14890 [Roseovarius sp. TE539]